MRTTPSGILAILLASAGFVSGAGTIQLQTSALANPRYCGGVLPPAGMFNFGVFVISANGSETLVFPLGVNTAQGGISAPSPFPIPDTDAGQVVSLRVMAWEAIYGTNWAQAFSGQFAITPVRQFTLGLATGPATIIWSATDPARFAPLQFCSLAGPKFIVTDQTVAEGSNGMIAVSFAVGLEYRSDPPTNYPKSVSFSTRSGTANSGLDFTPTNGILTFEQGESVKRVTVHLLADAMAEPDEQFTFELSNPFYAGFIKSVATCLITESRIIEVCLDGADSLVTLHSVSGRHYAVEYSTDLTTWNVVDGAGNVTGIGGPVTIRDSGAALGEQRLYRIRLL